MTKIDKLKKFAAEGIGPFYDSIEDGKDYCVSWPGEDQDICYIYISSSYNWGWTNVDFSSRFAGRSWSVKHDVTCEFYGVIAWENDEWLVKDYEIVSECRIKD
jgi:hypothetical protein